MAAKTSLARQLEKLKVPQTSVQKEKYGSVSFIYDFVEAKTIDIDTHYSYAINSLNNLIQIDSDLKKFQQILFHESSKKFDRALENKKSNDELNRNIEEFLFCISKYFQMTDTHKVLEYMIQKYKIHEYNIDSLIGSLLPYHETRIFTRLIQTCSAIKNPQNSRYFWMMKMFQEKGVPVPKSSLLKHCISNMEFTRFVTDSAFKAMEIDSKNSLFPSFLVSFCLNLLQKSTQDMLLSHILSVISKCLSMKNDQLYTVSYMIFIHLCNLVKLETKITNKILKQLLRQKQNINQYTLMAFEIIVKSQELSILSKKFLDKEMLNIISEYSNENTKFESLISAIILTILSNLNDEEMMQRIEVDKNFFHQWLEISNSQTTIMSIINWINNANISEEEEEKSYNIICYIIKIIEKMYPDWFISAISSIETVINLPSYLKSIRYSFVAKANLPLCVGVKHSDESIRKRSLSFIIKNFSMFINDLDNYDKLFLKTFIQNDLNQNFDHSQKVKLLVKIFEFKEKFLDLFNPEELDHFILEKLKWVENMINVETDTEINQFMKLKHLLIEFYCLRSHDNQDTAAKNFLEDLFFDEMQQILLMNLITNDFQLILIILNSQYAKSNPLFQVIASNFLKFKIDQEFTNLDEQKDHFISISAKIFDGFVNYLNKNVDHLNLNQNFCSRIKSQSVDNKFLLLFIYSLIKLTRNCAISKENLPKICQLSIEIYLHFLKDNRISSHLEVSITEVAQFNEIKMDDYFAFEYFNYNNEKISLLIAGYIVFGLINADVSIDDLPNPAYWFLTDVSKVPSYDIYYKIYCLLIQYAMPTEQNQKSKKIYKLFKRLYSHFIQNKIMIHSDCLKFFLPSMIDHNIQQQNQTLISLDNLFKDSTLLSLFIDCLKSNYQYLVCYLFLLSSKELELRRISLSNLARILAKLNENNNEEKELKIFMQCLINEEHLILTDENYISNFLNRHQSDSESLLVNKLTKMIISILTLNDLQIIPLHRVSLLKLLRYCDVNVKSTICKYYFDIFFKIDNQKMLLPDEQQQMEEIISFYNYGNSNIFSDNYCLLFLLKCIEKSGSVLTEQLSLSIYELITLSKFEIIYQNNKEYAVKLICTFLERELELSTKHSLSSVNYANLIDAMQKQLRLITVDSNIIIDTINYLLPIDFIYDSYAQQSKVEGEEEIQNKLESYKKNLNIKWKLFRIYVSLLSNNEQLDCTNELIKLLFDYLKLTFMQMDHANELTRQILLYSIVDCIELKFLKYSSILKQINIFASDPNKMIVDDENEFEMTNLINFIKNINVETVIDCLMSSKVKETQRVSLLLINLLAPYFHKQIVEYLATIFTFIGTNLLECDDQYSLSILFETMESIIPIIIAYNNNKDDNSKSSNLKQYIISVFIKSFTDIPPYRRLPLFTKLIQLLGPKQYLSIIVGNLMEKICLINSTTEKEESNVFLSKLFAAFSIDIQLLSLSAIFYLFKNKFLANQFKHSQKKINANQNLVPQENDQFMAINELIKNIFYEYKLTIVYDTDKLTCGLFLLNFSLSLISSEQFITSVNSMLFEKISVPLIYLINIIFELIILLNTGGGASKSNIYRKRMKTILDEILLKYNSLLPNDILLKEVVFELLNNTAKIDSNLSKLVKRKALELLNDKLTKINHHHIDLNTKINIMNNLSRHLSQYQNNVMQLDDQEIHNFQLILLAFKITAKFYDNNHDEKVGLSKKILFDAVNEIIAIVNLINASNIQGKMINLKTSLILCLAQILSTLSLDGLENIRDVITIILDNFKYNEEIIIISNVSALYKIVNTFAKFLSPHLKSIIIDVLPIYSACDPSSDLCKKLNILWNTIGKNVPKRIIFETVDIVYDMALLKSPKSIVELMNLFQISCEHIELSDVEILLKNLKSFMLKALSFRSKNYSNVDEITIERIETSFCQAFCTFIPKLTESNFRPIYYSLLDWSIKSMEQMKIMDKNNEKIFTVSDECYYRIISFYNFCSFLADRLKSLFCVFVAPTIVQNCQQILLAYHSTEPNQDHQPIDGKSEGACLKINDPNIGEALIQVVLLTISKCFLYDLNGAFVNKECVSLIMKPIINQVRKFFQKMILYCFN